MPPVTWHRSPNFKKGGKDRRVTCVVIHATATSGVNSPLEWLCDENSKVSAHYLIDRDGTVYHLVAETDVAWHAGESEWRDRQNVNTFSIGVELVNANDGEQHYPDKQVEACAGLVADACLRHGVRLEDVVGHKDVAPGRKTDPADFPWPDFRVLLRREGVA